MSHTDVTPATPAQRHLSGFDLAQVWFGAAISIGEILGGGLLFTVTALPLAAGLIAIVLGRIVGNGLMAAMASIGAETGLPTMVLTRPAFGVRGSYLPAVLNMVQLVGWTGWMIWIAAAYMDSLGVLAGIQLPLSAQEGYVQPPDPLHYVWIVSVGALCTVWTIAFVGRTWWKYVERAGTVLLLLLTIAMTAIVLAHLDFSKLAGGMPPLGILQGMDLVVAMSVSWLPLVADYSRYARSSRAGAAGTFWGYFAGGVWMYAVGLLIALAADASDPANMVVQAMAGQGVAWVVAAIVLIVVSTTTTTFLDIYSAVVSAQNLWPRLPVLAGSIFVGALGTVLALTLSIGAYEPFLIAISAVFLPAFTVVLADWYVLGRTGGAGRRASAPYPGSSWRAMLAWLTGFLVYDWAQGFPSLLFFYNALAKLAALFTGSAMVVNPPMPTFPYGASLPCILVTGAVYLLLMSPVARRDVTARG